MALAVVLAGSGFAYLAGNTVEASNAGMNSAAITGYTVSYISYTTNATVTDNHHGLSSVTFRLTAKGGTGVQPAHVYAEFGHGGASTPLEECRLSQAAGGWQAPNPPSFPGWWGVYSCQVDPPVSIKGADKLTVIAYQ